MEHMQMSVKDAFKSLRCKLCVNQAELAELIGVTKPSISAYETGKRRPSFKVVRRIKERAAERGIKINPEDFLVD